MKINIVGSMCTWVKELSTSYIIDDEIMFDCPQGSFKTLLNDYDLKKINKIIISHFHCDHFADIHLVLEFIFKRTKNNVRIIAPRTCRERLIEMFKLFEMGYLQNYLPERVTFIDAENNKIIKVDGYKIKCFKMVHRDLDAYGYTLENNGKIVGFSGDTSMCNNVRKIIKKSHAVFIDSANLAVDNRHLCVGEVNELSKEFPECKFYPIHLSAYSLLEIENTNLYHPKQGEVIVI